MERLTQRLRTGEVLMASNYEEKYTEQEWICVLQDRLAAYEDSDCEPEEVLPKDKVDEIALKLMRLADLESLCGYDRLRELAEVDKDGRVVVLPELDPAAYGSKDLDELCSTLSSLENAVAVLGSVFPLERGKLKLGKQAQKLQAQCKAIGYTEELAKPRPFELKNLMMERAKAQGATLPDGAATALLERCGEDPFLLENEVDKLCALSGYQTVSASMVAEMGTVSLEADVFEMIRMITAKNATGACKKLQTLLRLQQEPIAITAAMIGSYVDLYRVKLGAAKRKNYSAVHKDFGYKGSDYRLKRSAETAAHYTLPQLEACLQVLLELDQSLKSQPVAAQTLLETALCRLALAGSGR